ncbi:hypothetical protein [Streptomyces sp. NPDC017958]|uniref:hypothetical protein n=1 Tax=Streptomyces sp. NPDC017958 TaxID=3365021 RepID=UPI0037BAD428
MARPGSGGTEGMTGGKSRFDDIYGRPDPRAYFRRLAPLEYEIPHHAQPVFRQAATERAALDDGRAHGPAVLDLCCSYGINAALLNHDVTLAEMYERYTSPDSQTMSTAELKASDKEFYAGRRRPDPVPVFGLDVSAPAVQYALEVGLVDAAFTDDLEQGSTSPGLSRALADVGLMTLTGGGSWPAGGLQNRHALHMMRHRNDVIQKHVEGNRRSAACDLLTHTPAQRERGGISLSLTAGTLQAVRERRPARHHLRRRARRGDPPQDQ